jgi:Ca2+-binding EF-hand superfamily protein
MAYGSTTNAIRNDLQIALSQAGPARVIAGLAILTNQTRPTISQQLSAAKGIGIEDFILFDGAALSNSPTMQNDLRNYLQTQATFQSADFNRDFDVDARDWQFLEYAMTFAPGPPPPGFEQADLNGNAVMDEQDRVLFRDQFRRFRFGSSGVVGERELRAFLLAFTGPGPGGFQNGVLNLYDLDGDGDVDYADQLILHRLLTEPVPFDLDLNGDGVIDVDDLHAWYANQRDVNRDGVIDLADRDLLQQVIRDGELGHMVQP